jgi:hypothetical protein
LDGWPAVGAGQGFVIGLLVGPIIGGLSGLVVGALAGAIIVPAAVMSCCTSKCFFETL